MSTRAIAIVVLVALAPFAARAELDGGHPVDFVDVEMAAGLATDGGTFSVEGGVWYSTGRYIVRAQEKADLLARNKYLEEHAADGPGMKWVAISMAIGLLGGLVLGAYTAWQLKP